MKNQPVLSIMGLRAPLDMSALVITRRPMVELQTPSLALGSPYVRRLPDKAPNRGHLSGELGQTQGMPVLATVCIRAGTWQVATGVDAKVIRTTVRAAT